LGLIDPKQQCFALFGKFLRDMFHPAPKSWAKLPHALLTRVLLRSKQHPSMIISDKFSERRIPLRIDDFWKRALNGWCFLEEKVS